MNKKNFYFIAWTIQLTFTIGIVFLAYEHYHLRRQAKALIGVVYDANQGRKSSQYSVIGKKNELFYLESLRMCLDNWPNRLDLHGLAQVDSTLRLRSGVLYLTPAPSKIDIFPDLLIDYSGPSLCSMIPFIHRLRSHGYRVIDLFEPFERMKNRLSLFLRTDSHWSPGGFAFAAKIIAEKLSIEKGILPGKINYSMISDTQYSFRGDIGVIASQAGFQEFDTLILNRIYLGQSLYDTKSPGEVLVFGDSFARYFSIMAAGLQAHLAFELKQPVAAFSLIRQFPGNAELLIKYLNKHPEVKIVVWVFSAHYNFIP